VLTPSPFSSNSNAWGVVPRYTTKRLPSDNDEAPRAGDTMRAAASAIAKAMLSYGSAAVPLPSGLPGLVLRDLSTKMVSSPPWNQNWNVPPARPSALPSKATPVASTRPFAGSSGTKPNCNSYSPSVVPPNPLSGTVGS